MVRRIKTLATFGAGPFVTGDSEERFGNYNYNDVPELKGIFFAEFDNHQGPVILYQTEKAISKEGFSAWSSLIIPKSELFNRLLKISVPHEECKILGYPVGLENNSNHQKYERSTYIFNTCFVVASSTNADSIYEPIVQKVAEYFVELEQASFFLTRDGANHIPKIIEKIFNDLTKNRECVYKINDATSLYFKLCPSYRGIEPPEVSIFMVPMFVRDVELTKAVVEKMDVLSQRIIPMIDGIRTVKEIADEASIDQDLVVRCVRNLHFYECVSLVPVFLYSNTYVATERVQDFYKNNSEIADCLEFVKLRGQDDPTALPEFNDVFRLYLTMRCGMTLYDWVKEYRPRELGVDEHRLVQFGMHHQFLRKLTIYPVCTEKVTRSRLMQECNGTSSLEDIALKRGVDPHSLKEILELKRGSFEFIMK